MDLTRRDFLKTSTLITAAFGLQTTGLLRIDEALALETAAGGVSLVWLQGQACTGCSVSLLNSIFYTTIDDLLVNKLDLNYHSTVSAASGALAVANAEAAYSAGNYILVAEGAVPSAAGGGYCLLWPKMTMVQALTKYTARAKFILAVGACASYGGVAAAAPNVTGAKGLATSYRGKRVIKIPGCPAHPDWVVGTIAYLLKYGKAPSLDTNSRPTDFYSRTVHSQCPFNGEDWAAGLGQIGCLRGLGCKGPETRADCPSRRWNSAAAGKPGYNWCIGAGSPCYGCTEPGFPDAMSPFYQFTTGASGQTGDGEEGDDGFVTGASGQARAGRGEVDD